MRNPIKEHREKKEAEKRRKAEEEKRQKQQTIKLGIGVLAALFIICGIGALTEDKTPEPSTETQVVEVSTTQEPQTTEAVSTEESVTTEATTTEEISTEAPVTEEATPEPEDTTPVIDLAGIPAYSGSPYIEINGNVPYFADSELTTTSFESYSSLDSLGRCGVAYASIGTDLMPTEERGSIGQVKPSGWQTVKYNGVVDGNYLYNRCHLIGFQLTGENANEKNLITGTRYLNIEGMLPFENMTADYIKETGNHVLYRVTPVFDGNNLVASGVLMEGKSVEDNGEGILFNVYCYNVQPNITIDYANGNSSLNEGATTETASSEQQTAAPQTNNTSTGNNSTYILNTNTMKFHKPSCSSVKQMSDSNKSEYNGSRDDLISQGYDPCKRCNP